MDQRMDDIRAVMDAVGSRRGTLFGISEGGTLSLLFAHEHPERARGADPVRVLGPPPAGPDYPYGPSARAARGRHRRDGPGVGVPANGGTEVGRARPTTSGTAAGGRGTCGWRRARRWRRTSSG